MEQYPEAIEMDGQFHLSSRDASMAQHGSSLYGGLMSPYQHAHQVSSDSAPSNSDSLGLHREMAIDVPENFTGSQKEPPRYPLAMSSRQPFSPNNQDNRLMEQSSHPHDLPPLSREEEERHNDKIKYYEEAMKKRKDEENRIMREQEFLRESLRGSKKLQALEERQLQRGAMGIENPNYQAEDDDIENITSKASTLPLRKQDPFDGVLIKRPLDINDILSAVASLRENMNSLEDQETWTFLDQVFKQAGFHRALSIHNTVLDVSMKADPGRAVHENALDLCSDIVANLPNESYGNPGIQELRAILQKPIFQGMLLTHDQVCKQKATLLPVSNTEDENSYLFERASQYGENNIKIVRLLKTADPLGATVKNEGDSVVIGRVVKGGAADRSSLLHEGDEILEINGVEIRGRHINDVCELMANMTGTLTFVIVPSQDVVQTVNQPPVQGHPLVHVRAHFNYDPEDDDYIPCRELGISFQKGDILHIIGQEDALWWQAYREGEEDQALAGLIPSQNFMEQKWAMKQTIMGDNKENVKGKKKSKINCMKKKRKNRAKNLYNSNSDDLDAADSTIYEEVALYYPQPNRKRPVVLIGPPNVGRHELRQRLMESNLDRFAAAIPHTSRRRNENELEDKDYHFVTREQFEQDIAALRFVEYGEYEKNLYGTSLDSIGRTVQHGKICILNLYPQSLRILKSSDLKPYVVFIGPPNLERLKQLRQKQGAKVTDQELKEMIDKAREMEEHYGHYFDLVLVNADLNQTYDELLAAINRLEVEPQWVPAMWMK